MSEILDEIEESERKIVLSEKDIFLQIWFNPKKVFTFIIENTYEKHLVLLLVLSGIVRSFEKAIDGNWGDEFPFWAVILLAVIAGAFFGWISYLILAALLSLTGKWIGGQGSTGTIMTVLAYASIPYIFGFIISLPFYLFFGNDMFKSGNLLANYPDYYIYFFYVIGYTEVILGLWSFILFIIGVAMAHKFSILKSILNFFLISLLFGAVVFVVFFALKLG